MNIVITGASRGIGYELVRKMSKFSSHCVFAISRNKEKLNDLKQLCLNESGFENVIALPFDLTAFSKLAELKTEIEKHVSTIDILINNAGALVNKPFTELDENDFDRCFNANTKGPFFLIKQLMPLFAKNTHIVNIGSMGGVQGSVKFPGLSAYTSSKGALAILTECLAEEYKETGLKFNCLALGSAQTEMLEEAFPGYKAPLSAKEMADFIADFALNGHRYFNGKVLPVATTTP